MISLMEKMEVNMWWNNRLVQILLVACVIIGICIIAKLNLQINAGSNDVNMGVERTK